MNNCSFEQVFARPDIQVFIKEAGDKALLRNIALEETESISQGDPNRLPKFGLLYELQGYQYFKDWVRAGEQTNYTRASDLFNCSYRCWKALADLTVDTDPSHLIMSNMQPLSKEGCKVLAEELPERDLLPELNLGFRMAVAGMLSENTAEIRLELQRLNLDRTLFKRSNDWRFLVINYIAFAFTLLCRKSNGWADIRDALDYLNELRTLQGEFEKKYVESSDEPLQMAAALELVGLYHLAQMITLVGDYIKEGSPDFSSLVTRLDRHFDRSTNALNLARSPLLLHLGKLLWIGCVTLANNSIWTHVSGLGEGANQFAKVLTREGRLNPVLELWPSQQLALSQHMLDTYRKAVVIAMPTSAGKTLLAKFAIVQSKSLNPTGTIAYVVPTRALVNQVTTDLRADLAHVGKGLTIEQAIPAFELDPMESKLLSDPPDVLVTTPEKLDLLIRSNHTSVSRLAFVVADEIHNLTDFERGARLELLLGTLKLERKNIRFMLLSPFLPNSDEIAAWLGDGKQLPPILVNWRPNKRIVGSVDLRGGGRRRALIFETLDAADNADVNAGIKVPIGPTTYVPGNKNIENLSLGTVRAFSKRGGILMLCKGKGTATKRARKIAEQMPMKELSPLAEAATLYFETESGIHTSLIDCVKRGVAYHHAGLSQESRILIENLIKNYDVGVICGTTTLAQGINFPISTVIVETLKKGKRDIDYEDFWNIAGRAGRTLMDTVGVVAFPAPGSKRKKTYQKFLAGEAGQIISQLMEVVKNADGIMNRFNLQTLYSWPVLSPLLQFLSHAMRVAGKEEFIDNIEDLLRASLVYHQCRKMGDEPAQKLIDLCRAYLTLHGKEKGALALADKTGFSTPSVLSLLRNSSQDAELKRLDKWDDEVLFGNNIEPLKRRIEIVSGLPEIKLGSEEEGKFSPERVAGILRDWVKGANLYQISERYFARKESATEDSLERSNNYIFSKLVSLASWGLGALQTVCLSHIDSGEWKDVSYVPSMIFYGVPSKEAVWLRMIGVPRVLSEGLAGEMRLEKFGEPRGFEQLRSWVNSVSDERWSKVVPRSSKLKPKHCKLLWQVMSGAI